MTMEQLVVVALWLSYIGDDVGAKVLMGYIEAASEQIRYANKFLEKFASIA